MVVLFLLYLIYPFGLLFSSRKTENEKETDEIKSVSLILLSYNGEKYLKEKILFLIKELSCFQNYEIIIVDDFSSDGSKNILRSFEGFNNTKIIYKSKHEGIPHSMNIGVINSKYECLIFCDQRQQLSSNIIKSIVEPLTYKQIGAVSGCIFHIDKKNKYSILRKCENYIKSAESRVGCLIGVYGPFYAIKKNCYSIIPDNIILDDLYLSLKILKEKQIVFRKDCQIIDDDFSVLYDYKRVKRYLYGFLQLMNEKKVIADLDFKQQVMLIWHKYLRIVILLFIFLFYISVGIMVTKGLEYIIVFAILTIIGLLSILPFKFKYQLLPLNLTRIIIFYFIAFFDLIFNAICFKRIAINNLK